MAHWIFTQLDPAGRGGWFWALERDNGHGSLRSAASFEDLWQCMNDATRFGYYAGHYHVTVRKAGSARDGFATPADALLCRPSDMAGSASERSAPRRGQRSCATPSASH